MSYYYTPVGTNSSHQATYKCQKCGLDRTKEMHRSECSNCRCEDVKITFKKNVVVEYKPQDPNVTDLHDFSDELGWDCYKDE